MTHLLAISIGPVQEFIAAARRTRDLWFGSYLLSEISRAVARSVEQRGGRLIFPAMSSASNIANLILAELSDCDPEDVAMQAKQAAQRCWRECAEGARRRVSGVVRQDIWDAQVDDVIECYAAWVPRSSEYTADRARVMRLLAGRKNCRDFLPANGWAGVPKSSLDGLRESVLKQEDRSSWPKSLRLSTGEQLDVVGVTKRLGTEIGKGDDPRYPSVSRIAADPWLRGVAEHPALRRLKDACKKLKDEKGLHAIHEPHYQDFPYEGTVVYKNRHADLRAELKLEDSDLAEVAEALDALGEGPSPYLAVLVADGDHMGKTIAALSSPEAHRTFSQALAGFAEQARSIVSDHRGVLVYAGGDDVLAFLPVDQCLKCARMLRETFAERLEEYGSPTLSVGLALGHFLDNLEDLLEYGRTAERHAKVPWETDGSQHPRNGLAVHLHKRGGAPIAVRDNWSHGSSGEGNGNLDLRLHAMAEWLDADAIPGRMAHDLHMVAAVYDNWSDNAVQDAIRRDAITTLKKKQPREEGRMEAMTEMLRSRVSDAASLRRIGDELLVARQVAVAMRQAGGRAMRQEASP